MEHAGRRFDGPLNLVNVAYGLAPWLIAAGIFFAAAAAFAQETVAPPTFPASPVATAPAAAPAPAAAVLPAASSVADFRPVLNVVLEGLAGLLLAAAMFFARKLNTMFNLNIDTKQRGALYEGIDNILDSAVAYAANKGGNLATFETRNTIVRMAAGVVGARLPGAVKRFGLTREDIEERVAQRLERRLPGAEPGMLPNGAVIPQAGQVLTPRPPAPSTA